MSTEVLMEENTQKSSWWDDERKKKRMFIMLSFLVVCSIISSSLLYWQHATEQKIRDDCFARTQPVWNLVNVPPYTNDTRLLGEQVRIQSIVSQEYTACTHGTSLFANKTQAILDTNNQYIGVIQ